MPPRDETVAPAGAEHSTLYVAIEISRKSWVVGIKGPSGARIGLHALAAADVEGLRDPIERHRTKAERALGRAVGVLCCYEAGYEGTAASWRAGSGSRPSRGPAGRCGATRGSAATVRAGSAPSSSRWRGAGCASSPTARSADGTASAPPAVELRLGKIGAGFAQNLVRLAQLANLAFERPDPLTIVAGHARPGSAVSFSLTDPPPQRLGRAAELRRDRTHRRPLRAMLAPMLENQPDSPVANLRRITCRMSSHNSSPFSQDGASGKAGAVQFWAAKNPPHPE